VKGPTCPWVLGAEGLAGWAGGAAAGAGVGLLVCGAAVGAGVWAVGCVPELGADVLLVDGVGMVALGVAEAVELCARADATGEKIKDAINAPTIAFLAMRVAILTLRSGGNRNIFCLHRSILVRERLWITSFRVAQQLVGRNENAKAAGHRRYSEYKL